MAEFKADLNPKNNSMSLYDLMKMNEYMGGKSKVAKPEPKKPAPIIDKSTPFPPVNNMIKSGPDDDGVEFRFNNSQKE
jgi:hypothetical protein